MSSSYCEDMFDIAQRSKSTVRSRGYATLGFVRELAGALVPA